MLDWYFSGVDASIAVKYHCSVEEAEGLILKLEKELKDDRGNVKVIGLSLRETFSPQVKADLIGFKKEGILKEDFLFEGQEGIPQQE
jgi:hypothetical protein